MKDAIELYNDLYKLDHAARHKLTGYIGIKKSYLLDQINKSRKRANLPIWSDERMTSAVRCLLCTGAITELKGALSITSSYQGLRKMNEERLRLLVLESSFTHEEISAVKDFLRKQRIKFKSFLSLIKKDDGTYDISTSMGTFGSPDLQQWQPSSLSFVGRRSGRNGTGHYLASSIEESRYAQE